MAAFPTLHLTPPKFFRCGQAPGESVWRRLRTGVGKIAGPLCLALIAGASNLITPKATIDAVTPAFLFLAGCGLAIGLAFSLLGVETHGRQLALENDLPPVSQLDAVGNTATAESWEQVCKSRGSSRPLLTGGLACFML